MEIHDIGLESILNADWIPGPLSLLSSFFSSHRASPAVRGRERARRCRVTASIRKKWLTVPIDNERHFSPCWNVRPVRENFMRNKGYRLTRLRIKDVDIARREGDNMMPLVDIYISYVISSWIYHECIRSSYIPLTFWPYRWKIFFYHSFIKYIS